MVRPFHAEQLRPGKLAARNLPDNAATILLGLAMICALAYAARTVAIWLHMPTMISAVLLGYGAAFVLPAEWAMPGANVATGLMLRLGVALLGLRISFDQIAALGPTTAIAIPLIMAATILSVTLLCKRFLGDPSFGLLAGGAIAICGASAAMALSSVLPANPRSRASTLLVVICVTALSTIAMLLYPLLVPALGLSDFSAGVLLGASIHDVAQVVGAGYTLSDAVGENAIIVKLYRVALLAPILAIIQVTQIGSRTEGGRASWPLPPWFVVVFAGLCITNSLWVVPGIVIAKAGDLSSFFLLAAVTALGFKTSWRSLSAAGVVPIVIMVAGSLLILALSLLLVLP